jgi:GTP pyrophosphokinase
VEQDFDREYESAVELLPEFGDYLESLFKVLLRNENIRVHRIDYRVKGKKSTQLKLARPRKEPGDTRPRTLDSLTDLLGLRVITYSAEDVDRVASVIAAQFTVDRANSVDKRASLDPDRFGYLSLHYVAQLNPSTTGNPEYQRYQDRKFEIQIRSILQHAWAEVEHDLGYKTEEGVPRQVRRKFALAAGLLETVDDLFISLRRELGVHQDQAMATVSGDLPGPVLIDQDSLAAFVQSNARVAELDGLISRIRNVPMEDHVDPQFLGQQAQRLADLGFRSIDDLSSYLDKNADLFGRFIGQWLGLLYRPDRVGRPGRVVAPAMPVGITLYYAGAFRYAQDPGTVNEAGRRYWEYSAKQLDQALRPARPDGN